MAGMNYNYDEGATSWPFFVLTVLVVVTVPVLYSYFSGLSSGLESYKDNVEITRPKGYHTLIDGELTKFEALKSKSRIFNKKLALLVVLVVAILVLFWYSQTLAPQDFSTAFDPFEILDISSSSSDREIKSRYRKLSLVYHPDKIARDATDQQKAELEAQFVLINKAYKLLTDELTKLNYEKYGHPDGPQDITHGIALPIWFVEGSFSWIVTVLYVIAIAVALPIGVGKWWSSAQSYTKKGLHVTTARVFANRMLNHNPANIVTLDTIFHAISEATEFELMFAGSKDKDEIFRLIKAYVNRDFTSLETKDTLKIVSAAPPLIDGLIDIASVFRNSEMVLKAIEANKCVIQAINPSNSKYYQFLQLPFVELAKIDTSFQVFTIPKFLGLSKDDQKKFLRLNDTQLEQVIDVASKLPYIKLVESNFKVPGEVNVPPSSHSHLEIKVLVKSALYKSKPVISKKSIKEDESFESLKNPFKIMMDQPAVPPTFAPYFPGKNVNYNGWICALILQRDNKLSDQPQKFQNLSFANLIKPEGEGELDLGILKLQLASTTPPEPGNYQFRCIIRSLDYFGNDLEFPIIMKVENPPAVDEKDAYEIEDPDEDSVAGVMAAMKGEKVKRIEYDSSDEEDSEIESESDFSDLNTDTEDES